jgi:hypothetical protein
MGGEGSEEDFACMERKVSRCLGIAVMGWVAFFFSQQWMFFFMLSVASALK